MRLSGVVLRLINTSLLCLAIAVVAGCGGGSSGSSTPAPAATYVRGPYTGTLTDGSNIFGHGTAAAQLAYNDSVAGNPGTLKFADGTTINISVSVELEPTYLAFQVYPAASNLPAVNGTMTVGAAAGQYAGSGTEYVYQNQNGKTVPVAQPQAAAVSITAG